MKKIFYLLSITFLMLQSCSSEEDNTDDGNSPTDVSSAMFVKTIITKPINGDIDTSIITYDGNKIVSMENTDGDYAYNIHFTYTGDLITKTEQSNGEVVIYTYENNKVMTSTTIHPGENGTTSEIKKVYTHNDDGTISYTTSYFDEKTNAETFLLPGKFTFNNNNLVKSEEFYNSTIYTSAIEYDTKKNPFRNVLGLNLLPAEEPQIISSNNIIKWTSSQTVSGTMIEFSITSYTYTYDENGLPIGHKRFDTNGNLIETGQYFY